MWHTYPRLITFVFTLYCTVAAADTTTTPLASTVTVFASTPTLTAIPPTLNAKAYVLMDADSNKVLVDQNADARMPPASLTKMMTSYIISKAIREGRVHMDDLVTISDKAWRMSGSKMFVKKGDKIPIRSLLQGIIVDSGNDACVAMAEHIAGSEESFVTLMNQQAQALGMNNTHFTDSTGMPNPEHFMAAKDAALLAQALIHDFPEDYKWYSQKWFTYNGIKQPNRNRLLWHDSTVDGIKTGHTDEAGFCLVSSALRNNMRLISVVMGAPNDRQRAESSQHLLNFGFRFFETHKIYSSNTSLGQIRTWGGKIKQLPMGVIRDFYVTVPAGQISNIKITAAVSPDIRAPLTRGQPLGSLQASLNGQSIAETPLVALQDNPAGGLWRRMSDHIAIKIHHILSKSTA